MIVSTPQTTPDISAEAAIVAIRKARSAMARYRFMALVTGVMLLILCVELGIKYGLGAVTDVEGVMPFIAWVPFAHGWIYVVYLVTVADLWSKMRWGFGRLVTMVIAGVVPVMSFVLEKKIHSEAEAKLVALEKRYLA
ncbi:DUF3817 domain-containing protein [Promicromonospora sp. CA-289599]|uniref:DUF3817 domain-containing protein n=1 Tax=Promicromonospora sp. CA-289599 TaxID=3240014 RepID=UPI003D8F23C7